MGSRSITGRKLTVTKTYCCEHCGSVLHTELVSKYDATHDSSNITAYDPNAEKKIDEYMKNNPEIAAILGNMNNEIEKIKAEHKEERRKVGLIDNIYDYFR